MTNTLYTPRVPAIVRTVAYAVGLAVGALTILATGVVAAVAPEYTVATLGICGAASSAAAFVTGALGVAYRPTGHENTTN